MLSVPELQDARGVSNQQILRWLRIVPGGKTVGAGKHDPRREELRLSVRVSHLRSTVSAGCMQ